MTSLLGADWLRQFWWNILLWRFLCYFLSNLNTRDLLMVFVSISMHQFVCQQCMTAHNICLFVSLIKPNNAMISHSLILFIFWVSTTYRPMSTLGIVMSWYCLSFSWRKTIKSSASIVSQPIVVVP